MPYRGHQVFFASMATSTIKVNPVRTEDEVADAAILMRGLVEANKSLYGDDLETIEEYYKDAWFLSEQPIIPDEYSPPNGDVLISYINESPAGTVAIYRMDDTHCELKSMFVDPSFRKMGVAFRLCEAVIELARSQGYRIVRLTTGVRQGEARNLYRRFGFKQTSPWDVNPPDGYDYFELTV